MSLTGYVGMRPWASLVRLPGDRVAGRVVSVVPLEIGAVRPNPRLDSFLDGWVHSIGYLVH